MKRNNMQLMLAICGVFAVGPVWAAFSSGSTGVDGALSPTADVVITLPASGVLNYTTVNIPTGVTVRFQRNLANTAVTMLTTGDVNIAGVIDLSGESGKTTTTGGVVYTSAPLGGPGGFSGGLGGMPGSNTQAGTGLGPGGGGGGIDNTSSSVCYGASTGQGGGGGGYASVGANSPCVALYGYAVGVRTGYGGGAYGSIGMLPLVGGSGGGGGGGSLTSTGAGGTGGGGGGGALLLVSSGAVTLSGKIVAKGGMGGNPNNGQCWTNTVSNNPVLAGGGGGGAGGAVRILAAAYSGAGTVDVTGGLGACQSGNVTTTSMVGYLGSYTSGGNGAAGYSSVEVETTGTFSLATIPGLIITKIGGVAVASGSVALAADLPNPVSVEVSATGIPVGTAVKLTVTPAYADKYSVNTSALAGTATLTATGTINIPGGNSSILASTTYALTVAQGNAMSIYAQGERVKEVELVAGLNTPMIAKLITITGKVFEVSPAVLAKLGMA